jgi:hypothetical protein
LTIDLERRRPVWDAMSDVFLDTETRWGFPRVALVLLESGYTEEELDAIWRDEIVPECAWNLHQVAGEWASLVLDEEALAARAEGRRPLIERVVPAAPRGARPDFLVGQWNAIKELRTALLALPSEERAARAAMWTAFIHAYLEASLEKVLFLENHLVSLRGTGASEEALVAAFAEVRPIFRSLLDDEELADEERRAIDVRVQIGLAAHPPASGVL